MPLVVVLCFLLPALIPHFLWSEDLYAAFFVCSMFRYCFTLNASWLVNSAAHSWGDRPSVVVIGICINHRLNQSNFRRYDKRISPRESLIANLGTWGEGYHNYHHTFPWDYSTSETGSRMNVTTKIIDFFALIGWAYDRKTVPQDMIDKKKANSGADEHWSGEY